LNVNYFKNAELDDQMNKDLIKVLQICQPRTEINFKLIKTYYNVMRKYHTGYDRDIAGQQFGIAPNDLKSFIPESITNLETEIEKSHTDLEDAMNAATNSSEYKRIQEDNYENKNMKLIPLTQITQDMKSSQSSSTSFNNELNSLENIVSHMEKPDKVTSKMLAFVRKAASYYTFRINLLTKYFTKAKASIQGTLNNIKERNNDEFKSKTNTSHESPKLKVKISLSNEKMERVKELYEKCKEVEKYSEYKPLYDELTTLLHLKGSTIEAVGFTGTTAIVMYVKNPDEKINVSGRTLYHTKTKMDYLDNNGRLTEVKPTFRTMGGVLFPEPRIYVHVGVPLNRYSDTLSKKDVAHVVLDKIETVYRDPELGRTAVFIKTDKPIRVKPITPEESNSSNEKDKGDFAKEINEMLKNKFKE
jgi:preprotein translocase subunit Sss1